MNGYFGKISKEREVRAEEVDVVEKPSVSEKIKKPGVKPEKLKKILLIVILAVVAAYVIGAIFFHNRFYSRKSVFGIRITGQTVESLEEKIREKIGSYKLDIETRDGTETITAQEIGLAFDDQGEVERMMDEQNPLLWFVIPFSSKEDVRLSVLMDDEKFASRIAGLSCMQEENIAPPTDARLEFQGKTFEIVPETEGNEPDRAATEEAVKKAVAEGTAKISLDRLSCYVKPAVYRDDEKLIALQKNVNQLLNVQITYDFSDRSEVVDSDEIAGWITFGEDFSFDFDREKVYDYVHELGLKYDTFGLSRTFTTHSGETIKLRGGDYGWCINKNKTTDSLIEMIRAGESRTTEPVYLYEGVCRDTNDLGSTYIEVCIEDQTLWFYKDGACVLSTPVVTGNVSSGTGTPSGGVWAIDAKMSPYTLRGEDYESDVTYWLPFNGDVGIHDADWRNGKFGGQIYLTNGSHGCVNTPYSAVKKIYENVKIGYPVVVY